MRSFSKANENASNKRSPYEIEQARLAAQAANERLMNMQKEQKQKELQINRQMAELELMKQRTEEAKKIGRVVGGRSECN